MRKHSFLRALATALFIICLITIAASCSSANVAPVTDDPQPEPEVSLAPEPTQTPVPKTKPVLKPKPVVDMKDFWGALCGVWAPDDPELDIAFLEIGFSEDDNEPYLSIGWYYSEYYVEYVTNAVPVADGKYLLDC